ncbi:MAG: hypothetical protein NC127_08930 [Muribaculum sp.]|nr:hypothetical protein [Muribaculum sp.]
MIGALQQDLYGNYRNLKFTDVWNDVGDFLEDYNSNGITAIITDESATTLYYLLYARYGNSTIASSDINQFKYKVFSTVFMYGPTWEKRLEVQQAIRSLSLDELQKGGKAIYNTALNPNQAPTTNSLEELKYINSQNTTNYKKSKVDAYAVLIGLLETDVTERFIAQFKKLFLTVVSPELPLWYRTVEGAQDDI